MIKILFFNTDKGGVNYFRTETPAIQLQNDHSDKFDITVKDKFKENNINSIINELSEYNIIHYHRTLVNHLEDNLTIIKALKEKDIILIVDIDDYWILDKTHPLHAYSLKVRLKEFALSNIINADYVTTTTNEFANEIKFYNKNVYVLKNSVNKYISPQFQNNNKYDRDIVNITYLGGSSHLYDLSLLSGTINILNSDPEVKNKFKIILAGFDINGQISEKIMNPEFVKILKIVNLYNNNILSKIKLYKGDITKIKEIPDEIKEAFKDKVIIDKKRDIKPTESIYYKYEKILTDNYKLLNNNLEYSNYLNKFVKEKYINESNVNYIRRWTAKPNEYAKVLDETDILIAPLVDNKFNNFKSNLKQLEAATRSLPIVCSDVLPYNVEGVDGVNCFLIKNKKNQERDWAKALKKLILNKELRLKLGDKLNTDFANDYNLEFVTNKRVELYLKLLKKNELYI